MDVAPVLVPKHRLPPDLASRLTFVQANFLEAWPFEDESFDFVRIGFAGVAVPEHMWGHIFEEAARVCKPITGIIQCIDDLPVINYPVPAMGEAPGGIVHAQEGKVMLEKGSETTLGIVSSSSVETKESIVNTEENEDIIQAKAKAFEIALESCMSTISTFIRLITTTIFYTFIS